MPNPTPEFPPAPACTHAGCVFREHSDSIAHRNAFGVRFVVIPDKPTTAPDAPSSTLPPLSAGGANRPLKIRVPLSPAAREALKALAWMKSAAIAESNDDATGRAYVAMIERRALVVERFIRDGDALTPTTDTDAYADPDGRPDPVQSDRPPRRGSEGQAVPCACEPDDDGLYVRDCPGCGLTRATGHCQHDRIQRPCPRCAWMPDYARTPLQALGIV